MDKNLNIGRESETRAKFFIEADDLKTHAVVVGMTGSGKTGLSLAFLEELLRNDIPVIAIDPKGDLANLALMFPKLRADDFAPWIDDGSAAEIAEQWQKGIESSGLSATDLSSLKNRTEFRIFTPGSSIGEGVNLLDVLSFPADETDDETLAELQQNTISGILALCSIESNPLQDPEHIVLTKILDLAWSQRVTLSFEDLILQLVDPPFEKVGIFPTETFFPAKKRMDLAMKLNSIIASPSFKFWKQGNALDVGKMLEDSSGKTPINIFSITHLSESERHFFLTLLLSKIHIYTRKQPGARHLKALLFFDEVAGYLPPAPLNPPTKKPLLTMMKQSRAVGFGVMLATQNPIDLDYRALSNAGLWCIGRLSTKQDRDRLLKGLGRTDLDKSVQSLEKRQFLISRAKDNSAHIVGSRHVMCFLKGPMTKMDLKKLYELNLCTSWFSKTSTLKVSEQKIVSRTLENSNIPNTSNVEGSKSILSQTPASAALNTKFISQEHVFQAVTGGFFENLRRPMNTDGALFYFPVFFAKVSLVFDESRFGFELKEQKIFFSYTDPNTLEKKEALFDSKFFNLQEKYTANALFLPLSEEYDESKELNKLARKLKQQLYAEETKSCLVHKKYKIYSYADEKKESFLERLKNKIEDVVDLEKEKLNTKYSVKLRRLESKIQKKHDRIVDLEGASREKQWSEAINIGETLFSFFGGRKRSLKSVVSRRSQSSRAADRLENAREDLLDLEDEVMQLETELLTQVEAFDWKVLEEMDAVEEVEVSLEKNDIEILEHGIAWVPITSRI